MKPLISALAAAAALFCALPAQADIRVCETTLRGPAGEHTIRVEMEDGAIIYGEAVWAPPRQNAIANVEFPRLELNYAITNFDTGTRSTLRFVTVIHAARMTETRANTAEVTLSPYGGEMLTREWPFFARARDPEDTRFRNAERIGGSVHFFESEALEIALTAPQIETSVVTEHNERLATGVFLMVHRPALDAMFDHAFQQVRPRLANGRGCRALRHDEWSRAQGPAQEAFSLH